MKVSVSSVLCLQSFPVHLARRICLAACSEIWHLKSNILYCIVLYFSDIRTIKAPYACTKLHILCLSLKVSSPCFFFKTRTKNCEHYGYEYYIFVPILPLSFMCAFYDLLGYYYFLLLLLLMIATKKLLMA